MFHFACGAAVPGELYMLYNFVRFGTIMDKGYNLTHLKDKYREMYDQMQLLPKSEQMAFLKDAEKQVGGPLQLQYVKYNLFSIFLMMPEFTNPTTITVGWALPWATLRTQHIVTTFGGGCMSPFHR